MDDTRNSYSKEIFNSQSVVIPKRALTNREVQDQIPVSYSTRNLP